MPDLPADRPALPAEGTGSWKPTAPVPTGSTASPADPPTVRSKGSGSTSKRGPVAVGLPTVGARIGSFEIEEPIGAGGMGAVFRALDLSLERQVALKFLPLEQAHDLEAVQRFYQEARAAARLDHENIARVYTIGHDNDYHYIAFEYIEGRTIRERVAEHGKMPVAEAINYTLQIANALVHAAERKVVHRDIKPSNIIVTAQRRAKLVDMGLARRFERDAGDDGLTQSGMTLGTFDYISPEQARDPRDVDVRSDLYSLGCTLFHMLTGHPPFPEGTVLQKLLQHQEEPPPDVRAVNPSVPEDLAFILTKLMAKDRDRRFQAPEQLVRELLSVAGSLGLRSISPEGLVWMSATPRPAWIGQLVWAFPAVVLIGAVSALFISRAGRTLTEDLEGAAPTSLETALPVTNTSPPFPGPDPQQTEPAGPFAPEHPLDLTVRAGDELAAVLDQAPSGATITLADNGPFTLPIRNAPADADGARGPRRDLNIRAAASAHPVIRGIRTEIDPGANAALLFLAAGRVVLEGIEFLIDPQDAEANVAVVDADGTELTVRKCLFRLSGPAPRLSPARRVALRARAPRPSARNGERTPPPSIIEESFFDAGLQALWAQGPCDLLLRDCTFGPSTPTCWLDNTGAPAPVAARLAIQRSSFMTEAGPVFRLNQTNATIRMDDSVVAACRPGDSALVLSDLPDRLNWIGRGNLYSRVDPFLQSPLDATGKATIRRFTRWANESPRTRELASLATDATVWLVADPLRELALSNPVRAFQTRLEFAQKLDAGARRDPFRPGGDDPALAMNGPALPVRSDLIQPDPANTPTTPAQITPAAPGNGDMPEPMTVAPLTTTNDPPPVSTRPDPAPFRDPIFNEDLAPRTSPIARLIDPDAANAIRTAGELELALRADTPPLEPIRLLAGAEFVLESTDLTGKGRWVIKGPADPSLPRPRIRLDAKPVDPADPSGWHALLRLHAGSLEIQNVDIVIDLPENAAEPRRAAFALSAGAELTLERCTVTGAGPAAASALIAVLTPEAEPGAGAPINEAMTSAVGIKDSVLRTGGDLVDVAGRARLNLELSNVIVATAGSLVHGHGQAQPIEGDSPSLKLVIRQVFTRTAGGLVQLESAAFEPVLPRAEVIVRDSTLATTADGAPLVRVDGQDRLDALRDRVRWEGHGVAYHQIEVYRRDQTSQPGMVPLRFDRPDWEVAVAPREDGPYHGELRFLNPWDDRRTPWTLTLDDVRLDPQSPARSAAPDLTRIPPPPMLEAK